MMLYLLLLGIWAVTFADARIQCFECTDVPHPGDCTISTVCTDQQKCFVRQFITTGGLILYNSGCESAQRCATHGKRDLSGNDNNSNVSRSGHPSIVRRDDIPTCEECCDGDFCNDGGCGSLAIKQPARGPLCFQCDYLDNPGSCRHVAKCEVGEVCMLHELVPDTTLKIKQYSSSCQRPMVCDAYSHLHTAVGRRNVVHVFCHRCCTDDYCNDRCVATALPSATSPKMTTSIQSTVTSTTAAATTTSTTTTTTTTVKPAVVTKTNDQTQAPINAEIRCKQGGYSYLNAYKLCWKFHFETMHWNAANDVCKSEHGTLAIIDTQHKWHFLKAIMAKDQQYNHRTYIGARDVHSNGTYYWPDGSTVQTTSYNRAVSGIGQCLYIHEEEGTGWHGTSCNHPNGAFLCTKKV